MQVAMIVHCILCSSSRACLYKARELTESSRARLYKARELPEASSSRSAMGDDAEPDAADAAGAGDGSGGKGYWCYDSCVLMKNGYGTCTTENFHSWRPWGLTREDAKIGFEDHCKRSGNHRDFWTEFDSSLLQSLVDFAEPVFIPEDMGPKPSRKKRRGGGGHGTSDGGDDTAKMSKVAADAAAAALREAGIKNPTAGPAYPPPRRPLQLGGPSCSSASGSGGPFALARPKHVGHITMTIQEGKAMTEALGRVARSARNGQRLFGGGSNIIYLDKSVHWLGRDTLERCRMTNLYMQSYDVEEPLSGCSSTS